MCQDYSIICLHKKTLNVQIIIIANVYVYSFASYKCDSLGYY